MYRHFFALGLVLSLFVGGASAQQGAPPSAPLAGCVYIPTGFTLSDSAPRGLSCGSNGGLNVNVLSNAGASAPSDTRSTFTLDATKTSGAGSFVDIPLYGQGIVALRFAGLTASGATITFLSSNDPTQTPASPISSLNAATGITSGTRTVDGETRIPIAGRTTLRLQVTAAGTGAITGAVNVAGLAVSGIVDIGSPIAVSATAGPGGVSGAFLLPSSAATTNLTNVAIGAHRLFKIVGYNTTAGQVRIRFYDTASAAGTTVGTTTIRYSRVLPAGPFSFDMADVGLSFANGITFALVANAAATDATAPAVGAVTDLELDYQ